MSIDKETVTQAQASRLYRMGNNSGQGYAPYTDVPGEDTVEEAVANFEKDGWEVVLKAYNTSEVVVLSFEDGLVAVGGDGRGHGAYAVSISDVQDPDEDS